MGLGLMSHGGIIARVGEGVKPQDAAMFKLGSLMACRSGLLLGIMTPGGVAMMVRTFTAVLHKEDDLYVAECPEVGTVS